MNRKLIGNLLIATFLILSVSGIVMYFTPFTKSVASMHTFFALLFVSGVIFHIVNNKKPLGNYIKGKGQKKLKKFQGLFVFMAVLLVSVGLYHDLPGLNLIYKWGNQLRNQQLGKKEQTFDYQTISLSNTIGKHPISIELKKGKAFQYPLFAVWAEDSTGNYIETLYISRVISSSKYDYGKKTGEKWEAAIVRRPESLPYWSHKRGIKAKDGLYIPLGKSPDLDGVSGATPTSNFILNLKSKRRNLHNYRIFLEVNQSYDWNEYYSKKRFPNDAIYSGSGRVGQPSLIYAATVTPDNTHYIMKLTGHGHHSGKDGKLYPDVSKITTAKDIAERIILTVK